jgi:starch synthase
MAGTRHVLMIASENDALKGGKVGGVGDVVRDLPLALAKEGWRTTVLTPSYGFLHKENRATLLTRVEFPFEGRRTAGEIWEVTPRQPDDRVTHLVFAHPDLTGEAIYFNDPPGEAFAKDATKFALFCSAVGQYLCAPAAPCDLVHLHDWHSGFYFLLRELHPDFAHLKALRTVFTIHNLAIQGTRPMRGPSASVERWFPELFTPPAAWVDAWADPRYPVATFTPMAAGIALADKVNTVSPAYAEEILLPSDHGNGLYRGEGLEPVVRRAKEERRFFGILNGTEYPEESHSPQLSFPGTFRLAAAEVQAWSGKRPEPYLDGLTGRVQKMQSLRPSFMMTSVTRVVEQKIKLLFETTTAGGCAIDELMEAVRRANGVYLFLGTGTDDYELKLMEASRRHDRLVYLKGYSEPLAQALYRSGTMFMMPSSFEPCGIGQMIAMRNGQPCIVHAVGGLKDTVADQVNGFRFGGDSLGSQADQLLAAARGAIGLFLNDPVTWESLKRKAAAARFTWEKSAREYIDLLYT